MRIVEYRLFLFICICASHHKLTQSLCLPQEPTLHPKPPRVSNSTRISVHPSEPLEQGGHTTGTQIGTALKEDTYLPSVQSSVPG
ncbi:hypothetical protein BKA67DRAFT_571138 [Truncatella angustata]|uniref:Uncharacterized protein n=1 Tax=Truncatella angustata TaxID=152316 RepID=A0A9P8UG62_9PEZI|nr:uncharacterized protein BKA67DRAFT_571138 [Truncatella angustata]KAH6651523.1 hypothetical protein BKA67DRAFT_571138 [Truncatella angustata]